MSERGTSRASASRRRTAEALHLVGHCASATAAYGEALAIREHALGPKDALVAASLASLADARRCAGDTDGELSDLERAHELMPALPEKIAARVAAASRLAPVLLGR